MPFCCPHKKIIICFSHNESQLICQITWTGGIEILTMTPIMTPIYRAIEFTPFDTGCNSRRMNKLIFVW